ncbi:MAG: hypothetical protein ABSF14_08830 [Terriglobia bacterium]
MAKRPLVPRRNPARLFLRGLIMFQGAVQFVELLLELAGWPWPSWSFHFRQDTSILEMDRWDEPTAKTRPFGKSQTP